MPSTLSLLKALKQAYPRLQFKKGGDFSWDFTAQTITYPTKSHDPSWAPHLLHEVAHSHLSHQRYRRDIELLGMERDAWSYAQTSLSPQFSVEISPDIINSAMDSYRDWLHARSTCPNCQATGIQTMKNTYHCVACGRDWVVNEARLCQLRRYQIPK